MSTTVPHCYPDTTEQRQLDAEERQFLEENIATVAFHMGQPGAKLSIRSDRDALMVDPGDVLKEISRRLTRVPAQGSPHCGVTDALRKVLESIRVTNVSGHSYVSVVIEGRGFWSAQITGGHELFDIWQQRRDDALALPEAPQGKPDCGASTSFREWREGLGLVLYNCEKFRAAHAGAVASVAAGRKVTGLDMEPWELCADMFLSDADAIIDFLRASPLPSTDSNSGGSNA